MSVKQTRYDRMIGVGAFAVALIAGTSTAWAQTPSDNPATPVLTSKVT